MSAHWAWLALGVGLGCLAVLLVAAKWKIGLKASIVGLAISAPLAAIGAAWLHRLLASPVERLIGLALPFGLTCLFAFALAMLRFWRDPERVSPDGPGLVVSPADGEVLWIKLTADGETPVVEKAGHSFCLHELTGEPVTSVGAQIIAVEMNLLDVHVNRAPIAGTVRLARHIKGSFLSLRKAEAPFVNERVTSVISSDEHTVATVQIASRLVRRIVSYVREGQALTRGQRLGMIRFGSMVAVILPQSDGLVVRAHVGERVTAGVSVLACYGAQKGDDCR